MGDDLFAANLGKKKKRKKKKKKKKKKAKVKATPTDVDAYGTTQDGTETESNTASEDAVMTYKDMLDRAYRAIKEINPDITEKKRYVLAPPQIMRVGTTRTCWSNFADICKGMKRKPDHVLAYFLAELGNEGSIDGNSRLMLKGRFVPKKIESVLRNYIAAYVTCNMCRSPNTTLTKDSVSRLFFVNCKQCNASRAVTTIRIGARAVKRGERRKARR